MEKQAGLTFLRIKIKHLALEPELLKLEMRRVRARAHYKALSTAMQAGQNTAPYEDPWLAIELRNHRLMEIRPEARCAQIAYGFLRGRTYRQVEAKSKRTPDWKRIAEIALKYGDYPNGTRKDAVLDGLTRWSEVESKAKAA
jgi:hypothetical protein